MSSDLRLVASGRMVASGTSRQARGRGKTTPAIPPSLQFCGASLAEMRRNQQPERAGSSLNDHSANFSRRFRNEKRHSSFSRASPSREETEKTPRQ